jgi:ATP-binding cassette subfamily B protein/subfamily B ATP-binding cassette protein MsbA
LAACATLVLTYAVLGTLSVLNNYATIGIGQRMVGRLRSDLYGHLHRLSLSFHSRAQVGDLIYRVAANTLALQTPTMNCLFPAVTALALLTGMSVIMLRLDWKLTLIALGVCPALFVVIARLNSRISRMTSDVRRRESEVYSVVQQTMSLMRVIQAFTREKDEHRRFMDVSQRSLDSGLRLYTLQTIYSGVVNVIIALGTAAVVWVGARHALDGSLSIGALVIFVSYLASLYSPINSMFQTYGLAQGSRAAVQRVFDVLDVERNVKDNHRAIPAKSTRGEVAWEDVSFGYVPGHPVLSGVSLRARPRPEGGHRRPDGRRQVHAFEPPPTVLRSVDGPCARGRRRRAGISAPLPPAADRHGAPSAARVQRDPARQHRLRPVRRRA